MQRVDWVIAIVALAISCSLSHADVSQCIVPESVEFTAEGLSQYASFGTEVDLDGNLAIVGAPGDYTGDIQSGAAYIFRKNGLQWEQIAKLTPSDAMNSQKFGTSVAIDGNTAVVGSRVSNAIGSNRSVAYVFRNVAGEWQQVAELTNSLGSGDEFTDMNVAVHGDLVAIGCPRAASFRGAVFVFKDVGNLWLATALPGPVDPSGISRFGTSVALGDGRLAVGAPYGSNDGGIRCGAVYAYGESSSGEWYAPMRLAPDDATYYQYFGGGVALDGDTIVVGSTDANSPTTGHGAAYVFERAAGPWQQTAKLTVPEGLPAAYFGADVSISGDTIAVSARAAGGAITGRALLFRSEADWQYAGTLTPSDNAYSLGFGNTIAISGTTLLVGAADAAIDSVRTGTAYAYDLLPFSQDCNSNGVPDPCDIVTGTSTDCNGNGIPDECDIASQISGDCNADGIPDECRNIPLPEQTRFTSSDMTSNQRFGKGIDISGDTAVIGAIDSVSPAHGSAYIFRNDGGTWEQIAQLVPSDSAVDDRFGYSVAIDGTVAVIGAYSNSGDGDYAGAAYIFEETEGSWVQIVRLRPSDAAADKRFGASVSINGDTAIIGAPGDDEFGVGSGAAYVFDKVNGTWEQAAKLVADDADTYLSLGWSIDFDGNFVIAGAPNDDEFGIGSGAAYVFDKVNGTWEQAAKLIAGGATSLDYFGQSVAIDGDTAVAGFVNQDGNPSRRGAASVFRNVGSNWMEIDQLTTAGPIDGTNFGSHVRINGKTLIVSSAMETIGAAGAINGPAYVFRESQGHWRPFAQLGPSNGSESNHFGGSIAIEGATVLIGAAWEPSDAPTGAVYAYDLSPLDLRGDLNEDGDVDTDDLAILVNVMLDFDTDPLHVSRADVNCSGDVDGRDLQAFVTRLLS